ncbi:MAG: type II secretion system F family protein [Armatimonadota bacterium]
MPIYRYTAVDKTGKSFRGAMNAKNPQEVENNLASKGLNLQWISSSNNTSSSNIKKTPKAQHIKKSKGNVYNSSSIISDNQMAVFFQRFTTLIKSGIIILSALDELIQYTRNSRLKRALLDVRYKIENGSSLSSAFAQHSKIFPTFVISTIWVGELCGALDFALENITKIYEINTKNIIQARFGYILTKISIALFLFCLPFTRFEPIMQGMIVEQSINQVNYTQFLLSAAQTGLRNIGVFIFIIAIWAFIKSKPPIRKILDEYLLITPIWGKISLYRSISYVMKNFEKLFSAGIDINTAWNSASLTAINTAVARKLRSVSISNSMPVLEYFSRTRLFSVADLGTISTGEQSGKLPEAMSIIAERYEQKLNSLITTGRLFSTSTFLVIQLILSGIFTMLIASSYYKPLLSITDIIN